MELTSDALVDSLLALGAAALIATLWLWPRLARQRPLPVLGRIGLLTVTQASVLAVLALSVNNSFGFYTSWDDLLSPGGTKLVLTSNENHKGSTPVSDALVQPTTEGGLETVPNLPKGAPEEVGKIESVRVSGKETGYSDQMFVYLPPEYFDPKFALVRFPVMVGIAGFPGTTLNMLKELPVVQTAVDLQKNGKMPPTIVVLARPTVAPPRDTECVDVPGGPRAETWFVKDLPEALGSTYRIGRSAGSWGVFGYSTGGSCAMRLAMRFPNVYGSAVGLHGDFTVREDQFTGGNLFNGDRNLAQQSDLGWRLQNLPAPALNLLVVSTRKEADYAQTVQFVEQAQQTAASNPRFKVESLYLDDGGHNWDSWIRELPASLEWMGSHLG
ncbi:alpha/beta hydrolase-fold protein [Streptomyces sp. SP17BM10]|uniref:alpha/beta hydrolase n=1 Tax=Streptomyces sp. SP17BM10 TaxID=3002530 RepID=UPI002E79E44F|nr:alpha/beta hydrolase-fold protein [Streptomyces sp. SP17BM10]MEE1789146.1 alpha/beta hydrolase-fold protein [Streptomyces sp. SP17BM10]